ncbi:MAG: DUF2892 domain-containing protein [Candidatus Anstonellales archaeon]
MLERNVGDIDRSLRLLAGIGMMILGISIQSYLLFIPSFLLIATSLVGFCPLYHVLRKNTKTQIDHPYLIPDKPELPEIPTQQQVEMRDERESEDEEPIIRRRVKKNGKKK